MRGWNRFLWNRRLGSSPGGPWIARSGDPRPRLWLYKRVASLDLWSEKGQERHHLIEALTLYLRGAGHPVLTDDGWRDWDLETKADRWWRVRFGSVTEYHGDGRCLTRVRIATRATAATAAIAAGAILLAVAAIFGAPWNPVWTLGALFVASVIFESRHHAAVSRAAGVVVAAATGAGFQVPLREAEPPAAPVPDNVI